MKILFAADLVPDPNSGAAGTEYQTIHALRELGHEVDEIWAGDLPHRIRHGNLHYLLELPKGYRDAIARRWESKTYDVVHVNQGHAYLAAKDHLQHNRPGVFVCRSHGLDDHMAMVLKSWRRRLGIQDRSWCKYVPGMMIDALLARHDRLAARYASGFIVSGPHDRDFLIDTHRVAPNRVACIAQGVPDIFIERPACAFNRKRLKQILYVAGLAYWKGPHAVAAVANELFSTHMDASLTWVCHEADHAAAAQFLTSEARTHTEFVGWTSQEELLSIYDRCGIFVYPSLFDGFGKVFLEAMARGMDVIGTRTGGMRDIIRHGENGFFVDAHDSMEMVRIIRRLWENPCEAERVSKLARMTAAQYTWGRVARETAGFYRELCEMPSDG